MKIRTIVGCIIALGVTAWPMIPTFDPDWKILGVGYLFAALMVDPSDFKSLFKMWRGKE